MAGGQVGERAGRHRHVGLGYGDQEIVGNDENSDSRRSAEYCGCAGWNCLIGRRARPAGLSHHS